MVMCLGQGADMHMAQLMPLPVTISCSSKPRLVLPSWFYFSGTGSPGGGGGGGNSSQLYLTYPSDHDVLLYHMPICQQLHCYFSLQPTHPVSMQCTTTSYTVTVFIQVNLGGTLSFSAACSSREPLETSFLSFYGPDALPVTQLAV